MELRVFAVIPVKQMAIPCVAALLCAASGRAATHYVTPVNVAAGAPYTSWATAATNIQDAVDVSAVGATILVSNGLYNWGGAVAAGMTLTNRVAITGGRTVMAVSTNPADTIIQGAPDPSTTYGSAAIRCAYLANGSTLSGFTLTGGYSGTNSLCQPDMCGGGVLCRTISPTEHVVNCVIVSNSCVRYGGGTFGGIIENCVGKNNSTSSSGGGFGAGPATGYGYYACRVINCTVVSNLSGGTGGGIYAVDRVINSVIIYNQAASVGGVARRGPPIAHVSNCVIRCNSANNYGGAKVDFCVNSLIIENTAISGVVGGLHCISNVVNCTIASNRCSTAGGGGGVVAVYCVTNCIVYDNYAAGVENNYGATTTNFVYSCTYPLPNSDPSNTTNNPAFVDPETGDYRLTFHSPCVDSGVNITILSNDLDNVTRPVDGNSDGTAIYDMGCYEYIPPPGGTIFCFQ